MKKKQNQEQQLHISSFIKQPASLKLLILANTNIKYTELSVITKCVGLIKLDLSNNFLSELPLKFNSFPHMKILYLHDNQFAQMQIKGTQLQYVSLFKNPIKPENYRRFLIQNNSELLAIDFNVITSKEKYSDNSESVSFPIFSQIKWPIVQISNLEHEDDYLNLLKAQIFVINNVYKRTIKIQAIQKIFQGVNEAHKFKHKKLSKNFGIQFLPSVLKAVKKWKEYTQLKRKLRLILQKKGKEHLLDSRVEVYRKMRSDGVSEVMQAFLPLVRAKMKVREAMQRQSRSFRNFIPAKKQLQKNYLQFTENRDYIKSPAKLYFRYSQTDVLSKICLYAKRMFFKQKDYDICDEFNNLFRETKTKYYIFRKKDDLLNERSELLNSIHETTGYVISQVGIDRRHFLYTKKGHKQLKIKNLQKYQLSTKMRQKVDSCNRKLNYLYEKYDKLVQYEVGSYKILMMLLKLIRYINAGNSSQIISTQTAYFQTQVAYFDNKELQMKTKIHMGFQFFIRRIISANIIQRSWRKYITKKKSINVIQTIRRQRAQQLISKWLRNIIFNHRMSNLKNQSYCSSAWRDKQVYLHLDVYMNMPEPTNYLRLSQSLNDKHELYKILNKDTQVQIVQTNGRRWVKILYRNVKQAIKALSILRNNTYRLANGTSLKFLTAIQIINTKFLMQYEQKIKQLFKIKIELLKDEQVNIKTVIQIDNSEPYFVWSQVNALQHFTKFQNQQRNSTNVSIFIYNKHKRPLKVSCELYWVHQQTLYKNKKYSIISTKNVSAKTSVSKNNNAKIYLQPSKTSDDKDQFSLLDFEMEMKTNMKKGRGKRIMEAASKLERSLNKSNRRSSVGESINNKSLNKSHRMRVISDHRLQNLAETLNIRGK